MTIETANVSMESVTEKPNGADHIESLSSDSQTTLSHFDVPATKRLLRKMDFRLVPFLALLYL